MVIRWQCPYCGYARNVTRAAHGDEDAAPGSGRVIGRAACEACGSRVRFRLALCKAGASKAEREKARAAKVAREDERRRAREARAARETG